MQRDPQATGTHRSLFGFLAGFVLLLAVVNFWTMDVVRGSLLLALSVTIGLYVVRDARKA
ncbi:hypothetical protein CK500_04485 [Halorubrum salipaludis]|uniref:Uncharacterized protein n=1 Tax=Halorubrum salipaludis TaxID=2032630 RepID=A0A2A2FH00_9EURY|nr:hypothetical protein [Halorubrum salipaludis]PAU84781.1 hypothetical protein CK500_04485 [Halorubrum salipaludis]